MLLEDICIVLSRPGEAGNVGAVCRAMMNMGLRHLRIAGLRPPEPGKNRAGALSGETVLARAVHAGEIWEKAEFFDTLAEALADRSLVIGTTRRKGKRRKSFPLTPAEAAACLAERPGKAALVFGNERTGLEKEELELCSLSSYIPSDRSFPSLNLSHALQIYAYELFLRLSPDRGGGGLSGEGRWEPLERDALESLVKSITTSLKELGFYTQQGREEQEIFFRDIFSRAGVTIREGQYLDRIFRKASRLGNKNQR
ncbi:MAG: RNA methyltransferase [Spirochaetaceae bacterium]|jgi:tRNA/rRNA methyltransferase/tRNA (cytidine32/uridine32-2'-O)-methyltransferase|nr:RNA methyltransferase [Spirochaetaceae bacterium]